MKAQRDGIDIPDFRNTVVLEPWQLQELWDAGKRFITVEYTYHDHFVAQMKAIDAFVDAATGGRFDKNSYNFLYWSMADEAILTTSPHSALNHLDSIKEVQALGIDMGWWRPDNTFVPQVMWDAESDTLPESDGLAAVNPTADRAIPVLASCIEWASLPKYDLASGMYTGEYWWKACTDNDTRFASLPLWHASQFMTTIPSPFAQYFQGHEYGGWSVPQQWQYRGSRSDIAGVNCDWNLEEFNAA